MGEGKEAKGQMGRKARAQVTSRAGWGGAPCCAGSASLGTGPATPPRAQDPSGPEFLERCTGSKLFFQGALSAPIAVSQRPQEG